MNHIAPRAEPLIREIPLSRLVLAPENVRTTPPDPQAGGPTVAVLAARNLEEHVAVRVKPKTAANARTAVHRCIPPTLDRLPLVAVERAHVLEPQQKLCGRPSQANTVVKVLSHMYDLGADWGLVPEGCNPCRLVSKYPERTRERFLTDAEFAGLGRILDEAVTKET